VTAACFGYLFYNVDFAGAFRAARSLDMGWAALAVLAMAIQVPIVGVRWHRIVNAMVGAKDAIGRGDLIAITAVVYFLGQAMPNVASEGIRIFMLTQLGLHWRQSLAVVVVDRGLGILALLAVALVALVVPSKLAAMIEYRAVYIAVIAALVFLATLGLLLGPYVADLLVRWHYSVWIGQLARKTHDVMIKSPAGLDILWLTAVVQLLSIASVWLLMRAFGPAMPVTDAAVLFSVVFGATLLPISIGGWGVREIAVTTLLNRYGMPLEQALLFSISFGVILVISALPGGLVWAWYSPGKKAPSLRQENGL
jgi:uncharacterized membrane protein YbhN (UPF0104 family)